MDVLNTDWPGLAAEKGGCLNVIGNLPYYIVSQVLFSLADSHRSVDTAVLTMQLEVLHLMLLCCYVVVVVVVVIINSLFIIIILFYLII
jgi:16S rRNA A1518/A1519 N6-dimethyltransferase RsmA/KsgA/DIM1 with predicted DNA glycosylase/AP lyase activity